MSDPRAASPSFLSPGEDSPLRGPLNRRSLLSGLAALTAVGLATPLRAQDPWIGALLDDPEAPVGGNPQGDLTIISFFDYNCPFCKRTVEPLNAVLKADGGIRHVYKDWPILFPTSVYGAGLALAAKRSNRYEEAYGALMGVEGARVPKERMRGALEQAGFNVDELEEVAMTQRRDISDLLERNNLQAELLGLRGTPGFLIGDFIVMAALGEDDFRRIVREAREAL